MFSNIFFNNVLCIGVTDEDIICRIDRFNILYWNFTIEVSFYICNL